MAINATNIVEHAKANGWRVSVKTIADDVRGGTWKPNRADCPTFDLPTAIITFTRGDQTATMPVTPHASIPDAYRYVRGNRKLGQMLGTDGKAVLLPQLHEQLAAKPKTARKPRAAKPKPEAATS
jgi:hypothetical protein